MTIIQNENYKHNLIFNSTNDGIIVIDRDEKFIFLNKSAEKMIGIHKSEEWENRLRKSFHLVYYPVFFAQEE